MLIWIEYTFKPELFVFKTINSKKLICEFLLTFAYVFFSNWSFISYKLSNENSSSYGLSVGFLIFILYYLGKDVSGAIFNHAFLLALFVNKAIPLHVAGAYAMVQILASI